MEISNLPNKEYKVVIIKMFNEEREEKINTMKILTKRKYKEEPNRAEEYNNLN